MERRFAARMQEAPDGAVVDPRVFRDVQPRLENFLEPFVAGLREAEQKQHVRNYVTGLLSHLKRKTVESVAYLHDQDRHELALVMLDENGPLLPHRSVTGDDEMGRC